MLLAVAADDKDVGADFDHDASVEADANDDLSSEWLLDESECDIALRSACLQSSVQSHCDSNMWLTGDDFESEAMETSPSQEDTHDY